MNNQAAQTMPTLPRPYWKAGDVKDDYGNPYNETDLFTDDDMRAMYQQGYAATVAELRAEVVKELERAEKFMWQVRDTCARAEAAERRVAAALELAQKWQDKAADSWGEDKDDAARQQCCDELRATLTGADPT